MAFSPDGKTLASGSMDKTIKLWDVATGKEQATLKGHTGWVSSVAYSPDGKTLASGSGDGDDQAVGRGDGQGTGHPHRDTRAGVLRGVQSGRQDAGLGERGQDDQAVGRGRRARNRPPPRDDGTSVSSVAYSPDGKTLASAERRDQTIKLWDVATGKEQATLKGHTALW